MLAAERQQLILEILGRDGKVLSAPLSAELRVSEDTIRRDLRDLADAGLLRRVHGGAVPRNQPVLPYTDRHDQAPDAKSAIARIAAKLLKDGQVVILDGGTTSAQVARCLRPDLKATIVTNSPPAAEILSEHPAVEVILVGGQLQKSSRVIAGSMAIEMIRGIRADLCLLGICSIHPRVGISVASVEEAMLKRAMIESAAEVIALASPEKLGTVQPFVVGEVSRINILVTPRSVPDASLAPYQEIGMEIIRA